MVKIRHNSRYLVEGFVTLPFMFFISYPSIIFAFNKYLGE